MGGGQGVVEVLRGSGGRGWVGWESRGKGLG